MGRRQPLSDEFVVDSDDDSRRSGGAAAISEWSKDVGRNQSNTTNSALGSAARKITSPYKRSQAQDRDSFARTPLSKTSKIVTDSRRQVGRDSDPRSTLMITSRTTLSERVAIRARQKREKRGGVITFQDKVANYRKTNSEKAARRSGPAAVSTVGKDGSPVVPEDRNLERIGMKRSVASMTGGGDQQHADGVEDQVLAHGKTDTAVKTETGEGNGIDTEIALTVSGKERKRRRPNMPSLAKAAIPRTYEECSAADKALIDMKDAGVDWEVIRAEYEKLSGIQTQCKSTLPNRYTRMKTNFAAINDEDAIFLFQAKIEVDKQMSEELWPRVASRVEELGGLAYSPEALSRNWKRLSLIGDLTVMEAKRRVTRGHDAAIKSEDLDEYSEQGLAAVADNIADTNSKEE